MSSDLLKKQVAEAALKYVPDDAVIGVGSGSTVNYFIEALASIKHRIEGVVAASEASAAKLKACGIRLYDLNSVGNLTIYFDGADEVNAQRQLIKGGGGALTREKVLAAAAHHFICLVDESKYVTLLGQFPLAIEVIPMARSFVARQIVKLAGEPVYREGFVTDNGNIILDNYYLSFAEPLKLEQTLNNIPGVVAHGLFAMRCPEKVLIAGKGGVRELG